MLKENPTIGAESSAASTIRIAAYLAAAAAALAAFAAEATSVYASGENRVKEKASKKGSEIEFEEVLRAACE